MKMSSNKNQFIHDPKRRDAFKLMGLGTASLLAGSVTSTEAGTKLSIAASHKDATILIVGAGTGGMIAAARLRRSAPNAKITIIAPNTEHLYQSGQVYVAAGLYTEYDNKCQTSDLVPDGVTWLKEKITALDPDHHQITAEKSGKMNYDYLIVALGCEYDYSQIEGLKKGDIGKHGISSVYLNDLEEGSSTGAIVSKMWMMDIEREAAKKELKVLLTEPNTPIKGENVSLDMLFLTDDMLKGNGIKKGEDLHSKVTFTLAKSNDKLFRIPAINKVLNKKIKHAKNIKTAFGHTLKAVDTEKKTALFDTVEGDIELAYDYLHITPAMKPSKVLSDSPLSIQDGLMKGWMEIDEKTLNHPKYKNVFGIGDILGLDIGKSGGAAREQGIVIQDNLAAQMEEKKLPMQYSGYSIAPIKTAYGKILLVEYNKNGLAPTFPLDLTKPRWIWWAIDVHLMRRAYFELIMRGMM